MPRLSLPCLLSTCLLSSCIAQGTNPVDPYEPLNRKIHDFNMAFDATFLKPPAKLYRAVLPEPVRHGISNVYDNIHMITSVGNDILQGDLRYALKDTWRFGINSTFGVGGIFDVANQWGLPPHSNDLGLTLAKWGDKKSPYVVLPFLGPSTIRDTYGMIFDYTFLSPFPWITNPDIINPIILVRYVDLRSQLLDSEKLLDEALDKYTFIRDAYLQHRNYLITGQQPDNGDYVDDLAPSDYIEEESPAPKKPRLPLRA